MKVNLTVLLFLVVSLYLPARTGSAKESLAERVQRTIANWKSIDPNYLRDPANSDVLQALRSKAQNSSQVEARVLLLNIEDPQITQLCLIEFHKDHWFDRIAATRTLASSANPHLILRFVNDLNLEESAQSNTVTGGEEVTRYTPVSVLAAQVIQGIVLHSSEFNSDIKQWAQTLHPDGRDAEREAARNAMRVWWQENAGLLNAGKYDQVNPPSHMPTASPAASP